MVVGGGGCGVREFLGWDHPSLQGVLYSVVMGCVVANRMLGGGLF